MMGPTTTFGGVWLDGNEQVYVAVPGGRVVKRITPRGEVTVIARGTREWTAVGGTTSGNQLSLLENGAEGAARVRPMSR